MRYSQGLIVRPGVFLQGFQREDLHAEGDAVSVVHQFSLRRELLDKVCQSFDGSGNVLQRDGRVVVDVHGSRVTDLGLDLFKVS